jgi:hypothetical protein
MAYFSTLNSSIMVALQLLLADQELCKLLYYGEPNPLSQPNIPDTNILLMKNIFPLPKEPDSEKDQKALVCAYFYESEPYRKNSGFRQVWLCFDIICHIDVWMIDDGLRTYSISNRIDAMFNNRIVPELSINAMYFETWIQRKYSNYFYGYHLAYRLSNDSNVGCNSSGQT